MVTKRIVVLSLVLLMAGSVTAGSLKLKLSGPGAVNDSTIKAGEKVSLDIYCSNDTLRTGFTFGLSIKSPDSTIKNIIHVVDTAGGLNDSGDIKGYNGWENKSIWDFAGVMVVEKDWDGILPELIGFGGLAIKKSFNPQELGKVMSIELIVNEIGTLVVDSSFYPPGGKWIFASPPDKAPPEAPEWDGPYRYKVVK